MNAPLASLVRWRVLECAKHSARLRHALRQAACRGSYAWGTGLPAYRRLRFKRAGLPWFWSKSFYTIGPRGKLP